MQGIPQLTSPEPKHQIHQNCEHLPHDELAEDVPRSSTLDSTRCNGTVREYEPSDDKGVTRKAENVRQEV